MEKFTCCMCRKTIVKTKTKTKTNVWMNHNGMTYCISCTGKSKS